MQSLFLVAGVVVLMMTLVDVVWTTLGTHGGGPVSRHVTEPLWKLFVALHRRKPHHRLLSFAGSVLLATMVVFWVACVWAGWVLIFSSDSWSIAGSHDGAPADLAGRIYFVAYSMSSMGNGDFQPQGAGWRLVTSVMTLSGLGSLTLTITFLLEVLSAAVQKRALAVYVQDLGGSPRTILERSWTGESFDSLEQHLVQLTGMVHLYAEQHLAYPVLHYFHGEQKRSSSTLGIARLHETVLLLSEGVAPEKRLAPQATAPLRAAIAGLSETLKGMADSGGDPPPPPSLEILRSLGIPTVDAERFDDAVARERDLRRFLAGRLHGDGWRWDEI